jgi:hypothetical protein
VDAFAGRRAVGRTGDECDDNHCRCDGDNSDSRGSHNHASACYPGTADTYTHALIDSTEADRAKLLGRVMAPGAVT